MVISRRTLASSIFIVFALTTSASRADAQLIFESVGERALGMGGAFVAVADDATAAHWNPAGLVNGGPAGMTIGWYRFQFGNQKGEVQPGPVRRSGSFSSLGTWPLGISYGRFESAVIGANPDGFPRTELLKANQYGATILQSLIQGLVVGATFKYIRGEVVTDEPIGGSVEEAFDAVYERVGRARGAFDLDFGVLASAPKIRFGLTMKNLRSPTFGSLETAEITLKRQTRLGLAILPTSGLTLATDLELDTVDLRGDLRRMFALGGEARLGQHLAVRSGIRWNLEGTQRRVGAVGLSVRVRPSLWVDGHYSQGRADEDREFGAALRAGR